MQIFRATLVVALATLVSGGPAIRDTCSIGTRSCSSLGPITYQPEPCFPMTGVCYPTNYYAARDQGQFSASNGAFDRQLNAKCQAVCTSQSQCASYVGVINKASNGQTATGTCFFYNVKQIFPRQCADAPSMIVAYYETNVCYTTTTTTTTKPITTTTTSTTTKPMTTTSSTTSSTSSSTSTTVRTLYRYL